MGNDSNEDRRLGMGEGTTRRDFLNGRSRPLRTCPIAGHNPGGIDDFSGYGGIGDYAHANGNTLPVLTAAHRVRDGLHDVLSAAPSLGEDVESYDLVIVGSGLTGLMAAKEYQARTEGTRRCLILDNHSIFGGEARQNEFMVEGRRLLGPQGSNDFLAPKPDADTPIGTLFRECGIPYDFTMQTWDSSLKKLRFSFDNYSNMDGFNEKLVDVAYRFQSTDGARRSYWAENIWRDDLARTPFSPEARQSLLRWRRGEGTVHADDPRTLDQVDYRTYLEKMCGYRPEVTAFHQPVVGLLGGVSADAISARYGMHLVSHSNRLTYSFPGGNALLGRYLAAQLIPGLFPGGMSFSAMQWGRIDPARLDGEGPLRIRQNATVVSVSHRGGDPGSGIVDVIYVRANCIKRVRARAVIMATGGWITKHVVRDMPANIRAAYDQFCYAPALVANVALKNWRFLYRLNATAARWMDDGTMFGFCANIRQSIVTPDYNPPLHPDQPTLLTFYMGLYTPGLSAWEQGARGRMRLLSTSYAEYERIIRAQMAAMFAEAGFDPARDIDGIILNRWGHARVIQTPGFYYGLGGQTPGRETVARGFGRIAIAHAELNGAQNYTGAFQHGIRAGREVASWQ